MTQGQFLSRVHLIWIHNILLSRLLLLSKQPSLTYYLPIAGEEKRWLLVFLKIWTWFAKSIFYHNNYAIYTLSEWPQDTVNILRTHHYHHHPQHTSIANMFEHLCMSDWQGQVKVPNTTLSTMGKSLKLFWCLWIGYGWLHGIWKF